MKRRLVLGLAMMLIGACPVSGGDQSDSTGKFRVGFSQLDITPPVGTIMTGAKLRPAVGTDDPLMVRTLVVQNGPRTLAIVGIDLVKVRRDLVEAAMVQAGRRTGIAADAILICPSHNHSSPWVPMGGPNNREYLSTLPGRIAESIERAYQSLQPARMLLGRSLVYDGHHNRRVLVKSDGLALNTWLPKLNDIRKTPQVLGTEGPIDPELWVARFDAMDGKVLGTLVNFTCHPHMRDRDRLRTWSADFPGVIAQKMSQTYGPQAVCVFTQGAAGNINPTVQAAPDWKAQAAVFADAAVDAARRAVPIKEPIMVDYLRRDVVVPRCDPSRQRAEAIRRLAWRPDSFEKVRQQVARMPATRRVPVSAARIGPLGLATNAGELFVEWGLEIKKRSPFPHTVVCELTNDWIGYEPTQRAVRHEGYETLVGVRFVSPAGIETLVDTSVELLETLWRKGAGPVDGDNQPQPGSSSSSRSNTAPGSVSQ